MELFPDRDDSTVQGLQLNMTRSVQTHSNNIYEPVQCLIWEKCVIGICRSFWTSRGSMDFFVDVPYFKTVIMPVLYQMLS